MEMAGWRGPKCCRLSSQYCRQYGDFGCAQREQHSSFVACAWKPDALIVSQSPAIAPAVMTPACGHSLSKTGHSSSQILQYRSLWLPRNSKYARRCSRVSRSSSCERAGALQHASTALPSLAPSSFSLGGARAKIASCSPRAALFRLRLILSHNLRNARPGVSSLSLQVTFPSRPSAANFSRYLLGVTSTSKPL